MYSKVLAVAALAGCAVGQSLTDVLSNATQLTNLTSYLQSSDLVIALGSMQNITILAPTNAAFAKFSTTPVGDLLTANDTGSMQQLAGLLQYHVLQGTYSSFNDTMFVQSALMPTTYANVTGGQYVGLMEDGDNNFAVSGLLTQSEVMGNTITYDQGVIHMVDNVLYLPSNISQTAVDLNLTSAVGALQQVNLTETVDYMTDVTMFVPNNEAFQAIGSALPFLTTQRITDILEYHVVSGVVGFSTMLMNNMSLSTVQGNNVTITIDGSDVFVNSARVTVPDVIVANGVIHVIDNLLNPLNPTTINGNMTTNGTMTNSTMSGSSTMTSARTTGSPAFSGASSATNVPFTSGIATPTSSVDTTAGGSATAMQTGGSGASSTSNPAVPMKTGAIGAAALFGGAAIAMNL